MSHELEISESGQVAFALRGAPAWHGLANKIFDADETVDTATMLAAASLNGWDVRLAPVSALAPADYRFASEPYLVLRTNPFDQGTDVLATVGERYTPYQNEQLFAFGDNILDGGASWESAGSIKGGRKVFGSLALDRSIFLDPNGSNDETKVYLLVNTSHDGSVAVQASVTPVRVVCQNTLTAALRGVKQTYKIRHTQTVDGRVAAAREALGIAYKYVDAFEDEAKALFAQSVNDKIFNDIILALYPKPEKDTKGAVTKWENKVDVINSIYASPTCANVKGTAWGAYNALTERLDWHRNGRGANAAENVAAAASGFDPVTNAEKGKILAAVKELAFA